MLTEKDHTFVIGAYRENPFLEDTIRSLESQSVRGSIILSTSTPSRYLDDICERHEIPLVVNKGPRSAADDWNYGYNVAATPLVTIAHQDDLYESRYVECVLNAVNAYGSDVSLLFTDYYEIRDEQVVSHNALLNIKRIMNAPLGKRRFNGSRFVKRRTLAFGCSICCPSVTLVKSYLGDSVFDTALKNSCDYQTWVNLASKPGRFIYVPQQLVGHRIYEESATSKNICENIRKREDLEILSSLWPAPVARMVNAAYALSEKSNDLK